MISKCRICEQSKKEWSETSRHFLRKRNFKCVLCQDTKSVYHKPDDHYAGYSYECNNCHNYVWYSMDDKTVFKEELYFGEWDLIQDYEDNTSLICHVRNENIKLPALIDLSDVSKLYDKIKTYIIFS